MAFCFGHFFACLTIRGTLHEARLTVPLSESLEMQVAYCPFSLCSMLVGQLKDLRFPDAGLTAHTCRVQL